MFWRFINIEWLKDERGSAIVVIALAMIVLLSFMAFVVDAGLLYLVRVRLVNGVDAAALAGVQALPEDPQKAESLAWEFAHRNGVPDTHLAVSVSEDKREIMVEASQGVDLNFARIFGLSKAKVGAKSRARVGVVTGIRGVVPLGVEKQAFEYGERYILKYGSGEPEWPHSGNFGCLALGGRGAANYRRNLVEGYQDMLHVGDEVETEPGNMVGPTSGIEERIAKCNHTPKCTYDNFVLGCPRLVYVPIIDSLDVHGRSKVRIVGFAAFFLEGVEGHGGHSSVIGRFIKATADGEIGEGEDFGLRSYKLVE
ncbi:MAG: Tad domain-containing protein [Firmicutes bacterium]|nr:Tad domain-containing protein [Bacillota bacterium]